MAHYKDVIFSAAVVGEFCGMFYFTKKETIDSEEFKATQNMLIVMITINLVCGVTILILNYDSAFYTKA